MFSGKLLRFYIKDPSGESRTLKAKHRWRFSRWLVSNSTDFDSRCIVLYSKTHAKPTKFVDRAGTRPIFFRELRALDQRSENETISFPEPTCLLDSSKTRSSGIIHFKSPRFWDFRFHGACVQASRGKIDVDFFHKGIQYAFTSTLSWTLEMDYSRAPCLGADQKTRGLWERDWVTDDIIGCASTVVWHKIQNISTNIEAMLLKLSRDVAPYKIYQMVHILMLLWQHARFQSPASSKSNIIICSCTGYQMQLKMLKRRLNEGGTAIRLR